MDHFASVFYENGRYSPTYGSGTHTMPGIEIMDEMEDDRKISEIRSKQKKRGGADELTVVDQSKIFNIFFLLLG